MNPRSRRNGYGTLGGYTAAPSSYGFYPSYFSTPYYSGYSSGYTSGYSSYYSRSSAYTPSTSNYGLRSKSQEPSLAKEASVTRELFREQAGGRDYREQAGGRDYTPALEGAAAAPPSRAAWRGSSSSLAPASARVPDWVSSASNRFSKATASLYQKSRGALGLLKSSSLFDLRGSQTDLRSSQTDLRSSQMDLRSSQTDLRSSQMDLRSSQSDLRASRSDLRSSQSDLRTSRNDLRGPQADFRGSLSNLRGSVSDLRSSTTDLNRCASELRSSTTSLSVGQPVPRPRDTITVRARRQTIQVSELDLNRARMWGGGERGERTPQREVLGRKGSYGDLGYSSSSYSSRRGSVRDSEEPSSSSEPDYRKLWEASQAENAQLRLEMAEVRRELEDTRRRLREALLERGGGPDKSALEAKLERMQEEIAALQGLREENMELREQNSSLTLAISKMAENAAKTTRV